MGGRVASVKGLVQVQRWMPQAYSFISLRAMSSRLFVGGLSFTTEEEGLRNAFSKHGEVVDARIVTDRESGRSRGFGFVTFLTEAEADTAKDKMNGQFLDGRVIRVDRATPRPAPPLPPPRSSIPAQEEQSSPQDWGTITSPIAAVPQNAGLVQSPGAAADLPSLSSLASSVASPPPPITGGVPPPAPPSTPPLPPPPPSTSAPSPVEPARPSFSFNFDFSTPDPNYVPRSRPARLRPSMMDYEFGLFSDTSKFPFNTNFGTGFLRVRGPEAEFDFADIKEALALRKAAALAAKQEAEAAAAAALAAKEGEEAVAKQAQEVVVSTTPSSQAAAAVTMAEEATVKLAQEAVVATITFSEAVGESSTVGAMDHFHTPQKQEAASEEKLSEQASVVVEAAGAEATDMQQKEVTVSLEKEFVVAAVSVPKANGTLQEQEVIAGNKESKEVILIHEDTSMTQVQAASAVDEESKEAAISVVSASVFSATDILQKQEVPFIMKEPQEAPPVAMASISPDHALGDLSSSSAIPAIGSAGIARAMDMPRKQEVAVLENKAQEAPPVVTSSRTPKWSPEVSLQNQELDAIEKESEEALPAVATSANELKMGMSSSAGTPFENSASASNIPAVVGKEIITPSSTLDHSQENLSQNEEMDLSGKESHGVPVVVTSFACTSKADLPTRSSTPVVSAAVAMAAETPQKQEGAVPGQRLQDTIPTIVPSVAPDHLQKELSSQHLLGSRILSLESSQGASSESSSPAEVDVPQLRQVGL